MRFVVLGDLHLDPRNPEPFERARDQIRALEPEAIICLGDLGSGRKSGTRGSFEAARSYLASFGVPSSAILGNHDLERIDQFSSDAEVVQCFTEVFECERPYQCVELGETLGILLSSTGFRGNRGYQHEVSIDDAQFAWFRETLEANPERPTAVFSHAPPLGSHLRVLQYPHLRAGNAWLNQSNRPQRFLDLLGEHPQVRLWFSGHNHLGQNYPDSVSLVGRCLFVHTGVIGRETRDGQRHSRLVYHATDTRTDQPSIRVDTLDHATGQLAADVRFDLSANRIERPPPAPAEPMDRFFSPRSFDDSKTDSECFEMGQSLFCKHRGMLVEYDRRLGDPIGVVDDWPGRSRITYEGDCVVVHSWLGRQRIHANPDGFYFRIPSRKPRLINEVRVAVARRLGRRVW